MGQISQFQIRFDAEQDRLLLRVQTSDRAEYRFWLTRRFVTLLWPTLVKIASANTQVSSQFDAAGRGAVLSFQHEHAVNSSDFKTKYRTDALTTPLGENPILLAKIQLKNHRGGGTSLSLQPREGAGIELALTQAMTHSLCKLLCDGVGIANWHLSLQISPSDTAKHAIPTVLN